MEVNEAIRGRRSIRSFKSDPIPRKLLEEMLDTCRWAPSASNTQAWEFAVLGGKAIDEVKARIAEKVEAEWDTDTLNFRNINPDIPYPVLDEPYRQRKIDTRNRIDSRQFPAGTEALDHKREAYRLNGARFHGAPNAIIIYTEKYLCPKAILDIGIIAQTIALAAHARGLDTCLMMMPLLWPEIVREPLGLPESKFMALSIAIGYPDTEALVNSVERVREPLDTFTHWHGL
ncbi:nitroreductase [Chloroflexota bacterium]